MKHYYNSVEITEESKFFYSFIIGNRKFVYHSLERAKAGIRQHLKGIFPVEAYECDGQIIDGERGGKWLGGMCQL